MQSHARAGTAPHVGGRGVFGVVLEGGTLTSSAAGSVPALQYGVIHTCVGGAGNGAGRGGGFVGTLLGPEGTGDPGVAAAVLVWLWWPGGALGCLWFRAVLFLVPPSLFCGCRAAVWAWCLPGGGGFGGGGWAVSGWSLRTAQWTRASFELLLL